MTGVERPRGLSIVVAMRCLDVRAKPQPARVPRNWMNNTNQREPAGFWHAALFYHGEDGFVAGTLPFIRDGIDAGDPVLVVVGGVKIDLLRSRLQADASKVDFVDMGVVGRNPARIIPAWSDFVQDCAREDHPVRGIGEPIGPDRRADELVECQLHEKLINIAFDEGPAWKLLCPYDLAALPAEVVNEARRSHPFVVEDGLHRACSYYSDVDEPFQGPLPEPSASAVEFVFETESLADLRHSVFSLALDKGFDTARATEAVIAVNEIATNSLRHGGGSGTMWAWVENDTLIFEVRDAGYIREALVGRRRPGEDGASGRGLWMVNQLCELVQVRSSHEGSAVRLHFREKLPVSSVG